MSVVSLISAPAPRTRARPARRARPWRRGDLLVAVEARVGGLGGEPRHLGRRLAHDGHRRGEHVGQLEVVEADQRRLRVGVGQVAQRAHGADGDPVVGGEQGGRAARGGQREDAPDGASASPAACAPGTISSGSTSRPASRSASAAPATRSRAVQTRSESVITAILRWPWATRCSTAVRAPPRAVAEDGVDVDPDRRAVQEDDRRVAGLGQLAAQVGVVLAGRDHQDRVDRAAQEAQDQLLLARRVLAAGAGQQQVALGVGELLDRAGELRVERVGDVLDHEAERAGAAVAQAARQLVAGEAERLDRRGDAARPSPARRPAPR